MANMSYCRFENTSNDLADCVGVMQEAYSKEELDLNEYEKDAYARMKKLCKAFLEEDARLRADFAACETIAGLLDD